eukprot:PITA_25209
MDEELEQIEKNNTWELVPRPKDKNVIGTKWIFKNKLNENGEVIRNKARLVCKGYAQQEGIDFQETFASAPRAWYYRLDRYLHQQGFSKGSADSNIYVKIENNKLLILVVYVDDIIFGSNEEAMSQSFALVMQKEFEMSLLGELTYFLGLQIQQNEGGIFLSQTKYFKQILKKCGMEDAKPVCTPMVTGYSISAHDELAAVNQPTYRSMIGSLLYLTAEAEYVAAAYCYTQLLWMMQTLQDFQINCTPPIPILCDNTSAIIISKNPVMHSKTKHIPIKYHFLWEQVLEQKVKLEYVPSKEQVADIFTKPLPRETFEYLRHKLGVVDVSSCC